MSDQIWWYATRAAGLMTWATSATSIVLGLLLSLNVTRQRSRRLPSKPWLIDLHRFVGGMSVVFLVLHMITLWADSFVHFGWAELLIPGASAWRPLAVAWGIVAAWLLAAVEGSSLIKKFLPERLWHGIHLGAYLVCIMGTVHAISAGSDVTNPIVMAVGGGLWLAIVVLTILRVATIRRSDYGPHNDRRKEQIELARGMRERRDSSTPPAQKESLADRLAEATTR